MSESVPKGSAWPISTWLSAISLTFGSFALISSELLPMAVLTPIAAELAVDVVGTSAPLYVTAICAVLAAVLIATQRVPGADPQTPAPTAE